MDIRSIRTGPAQDTQWIYDSPVHSDVEAKLRQLLLELGNDKILGMQVCLNDEIIYDSLCRYSVLMEFTSCTN